MNVENCNTAFFSLHTEITILREGWRSVLFRKKIRHFFSGAHISRLPPTFLRSHSNYHLLLPYPPPAFLLAFSSPFFSVNLDGGVDFPETEIQI